MKAGLLVLLLSAVACSSVPPLPEGAVPLRADVFVQPLRQDVWRHVSFRWFQGGGAVPSNGLIVRADGGALIIDTAWNPEQTAAVLDWTQANVGAVKAVVVTHSHDDRTGGLAAVQTRGIPSIALEATATLATKAGGPSVEQPVQSGFRLEPLGVAGELFFPGAGHSSDNAVVFLEDLRVLAGTCMVKSVAAEGLGNTADADLASWPIAIGRLQERYPNTEWVVPGHGSPGGLELLAHTADLLARESN